MKLLRIALVLVLAVIVVGVSVWAYFTFTNPSLFSSVGTTALPCPSGAIAGSGQTRFTITISGMGFNESRYSIPCPTMSVLKGQSVTIHLVNNDRETHSVAITHYLASGVVVGPGQSHDVTFTADQAGSFVIYCNIGCFAHNYMQSGRLTVTD